MSSNEFHIHLHSSIEEIDLDKWNELVPNNNPFVRHEFFSSLESGKCVNHQSGWHPQYFILKRGEVIECAFFAFLKLDSYGEFIFDWEWARAFQQYQIPYYPKLTTAIPYSPITAPKVLGSIDLFTEVLLPRVNEFYLKNTLSSFHLLFTSATEQRAFNHLEFAERSSFQYHWSNDSYRNFDEFLSKLKKNRRKSIKRERRAVQDLAYVELSGDQVQEDDLVYFYESYLDTIDRKHSQAYLSREFFLSLFLKIPKNIILLQARDKETNRILGNALYLKSDTRIYGRYWGCSEHIEFLHFELCLYRGIDIAIREKLEVFEAGAQGEHKRLRGFKPVITKSLHHIKHPQFSDAIFDFIDREKEGIQELFNEFETVSPFKKEHMS